MDLDHGRAPALAPFDEKTDVDAESAKVTSIDSLPPDVLSHIMCLTACTKTLARASQACRQWVECANVGAIERGAALGYAEFDDTFQNAARLLHELHVAPATACLPDSFPALQPSAALRLLSRDFAHYTLRLCPTRQLCMPWETSAHAPETAGSAEYACLAALFRSALGDAAGECSQRDLQALIEAGWAEGFDPDGAAHFGGHLLGKEGKEAYIGANDCVVALLHRRFRVAIVDILDRRTAGEAIFELASKIFGPPPQHSDDALTEDGVDLLALQQPLDTSGVPTCMCGLPAQQRSQQGRPFWACSKGLPDPRGEGCGFFKWAGRQWARLPMMLQLDGHAVLVLGTVETPSSSERAILVADPSDRGRDLLGRPSLEPGRDAGRDLMFVTPDELNGQLYQLVVLRDERLLGGVAAATILHENGMDLPPDHKGLNWAALWDAGTWSISAHGPVDSPGQWIREAMSGSAS